MSNTLMSTRAGCITDHALMGGVAAFCGTGGLATGRRACMRLLCYPLFFLNAIRICGPKSIPIRGRPDAIDWTNRTIVEHKRRTVRLLSFVPFHERVQCHLYMHIFGFKQANLVETFGTQILVHRIEFDASIWNKIVAKVEHLTPSCSTSLNNTHLDVIPQSDDICGDTSCTHPE